MRNSNQGNDGTSILQMLIMHIWFGWLCHILFRLMWLNEEKWAICVMSLWRWFKRICWMNEKKCENKLSINCHRSTFDAEFGEKSFFFHETRKNNLNDMQHTFCGYRLVTWQIAANFFFQFFSIDSICRRLIEP